MSNALSLLLILALIAGGIMLALAPHTGAAVAGALAEVDLSTLSLYKVNGVEIIPAEHGVDKHKADYVLAVMACMTKGSKYMYLEKDKETIHFLCEMDDGRMADVVVKVARAAKKLFEKTAFPRITEAVALKAMLEMGATPLKMQTLLKWLGIGG